MPITSWLRTSVAAFTGYGNPLYRPTTEVWRDVVDGLVSSSEAKAKYGVVIDPGSQQVDEAATAELRGA